MTSEVGDGRGARAAEAVSAVRGAGPVSPATRADGDGIAAGRSAEASASSAPAPANRPGFLRRYRLPLALGAIALCLYVGSILYILYGRGQIA